MLGMNGLRDRVVLRADGGLSIGREIVTADKIFAPGRANCTVRAILSRSMGAKAGFSARCNCRGQRRRRIIGRCHTALTRVLELIFPLCSGRRPTA